MAKHGKPKRIRVGIAQAHILTRHRKNGEGDVEHKKSEILKAAEGLIGEGLFDAKPL